MRQPRILCPKRTSTYHCISRIVDRNLVIGEEEKRFFYRWMRRLEEFCGVRILTYCLMSNHFHILVRVPCKVEQPGLTEQQLRDFLPCLYSGRQLLAMRRDLDQASAASEKGHGRWLTEILARYDARRYDLSSFLKDLKQRFSQWYNGRTQRCGHLWESTFKSVLVEDGEETLLAMAAYIDLNPVRAGLCDDPKDYRWSGYGEAVAGRNQGSRNSRRGLSEMLQGTAFGRNRSVTWRMAARRYRILLYSLGERREADPKTGAPARAGMSREAVEAELVRGGDLPLADILRCRVRYFSEGAVLGSKEFVDEIFKNHRRRFGERRQTGALTMSGADWGGLRVLHQPRGSSSSDS